MKGLVLALFAAYWVAVIVIWIAARSVFDQVGGLPRGQVGAEAAEVLALTALLSLLSTPGPRRPRRPPDLGAAPRPARTRSGRRAAPRSGGRRGRRGPGVARAAQSAVRRHRARLAMAVLGDLDRFPGRHIKGAGCGSRARRTAIASRARCRRTAD